MIAHPAQMTGLYLPILWTIKPDAMDAADDPKDNGSCFTPAIVALEPRIWKYRGT